ncbi:MAG: hypothetical protein J0L79_01380 [Rickettsiales bacterium]|nr:hypothetical protein [Rickettsiales bacterium]
MARKIKLVKHAFNKADFSAEELSHLKSMYTGAFAQKMLDSLGEEGVTAILGDSADITE